MNHKKPSHEEYCAKVIDFMKQFENTISSQLPKSIEAALCLEYVKRQLQTQISLIRRGNNKEVERRFHPMSISIDFQMRDRISNPNYLYLVSISELLPNAVIICFNC